MKASTLFLGFTFLVLAGALTGLWQAFGPRSPRPARPDSPPTLAAAPPAAEAPPRPAERGVRSVYPGGRPSAARPAPPPEAASPPAPQRSATAEPPPSGDASPSHGEAGPQIPADAADLNTASLEKLNGLGAGMIGRTIIANRPYSAPDELLAKRVLNRRDYETIKPHVFVP